METRQAPTTEMIAPALTSGPNTSWSGLTHFEKLSRNTSDNCISGITTMMGATATAA